MWKKEYSKCGFTGHGQTVKAAQADCEKQMDAALSPLDWQPRFVEYRGLRYMIYRSLYGWTVERVDNEWDNVRNPHSHGSSSGYGADTQALEKAMESTALNAAQNMWQPSDGVGVPPELAPIMSPYVQDDLLGWQMVQLAYRARAAELGLTLPIADYAISQCIIEWAFVHKNEFDTRNRA